MSNPNLKGRATAAFTILTDIEDNVLRMVITADVVSEDSAVWETTANGTVALGKAVAELGKIATPITAAERKLEAQVSMYVNAGLSDDEALALATQVNSL